MTLSSDNGRVLRAVKVVFLVLILLHCPTFSAADEKILLSPILKMRVTSSFGYREDPISHHQSFHPGIDLGALTGTLVRAVATGQVVFAGRFQGYGILVVIRHGKILSTHYAHLKRVLVNPGEYVRRGEIVGFVGATGRVTGAHLHFELRLRGRPADPRRFLT